MAYIEGRPMERSGGEVDLKDWDFGDLDSILARVLGEAITETLETQPPKIDLFLDEDDGSVSILVELPFGTDDDPEYIIDFDILIEGFLNHSPEDAPMFSRALRRMADRIDGIIAEDKKDVANDA